ncbi:MAG TPA: 16S rRNA (cytosine(1402)-N(4))-methyltransferase RsmH [Mycobacteriales bacterium]|jgi:16S rRNA (cytosine1402-N4)-methyltransferase|nr:16S rRNA (cytosine(1402)-N(4))-methyltransferase RsmH [Mycobacteriales bacterium]
MEQHTAHVPVMASRVMELLDPALADATPQRPAVLVDATLGLAGHASEFLARYPHLVLVGLDRDPAALRRSEARLTAYAARVHLVHARYDELPAVLERLGFDRIDAALFDLGVSSMQLDDRERGFAYSYDSRLDMRMDPTTGLTAEDIVNSYSVAQLARVLSEYGQERFAKRVASAIVEARQKTPLRSSAVLAELVRNAIPAATRRTGGHPAKRTFQALRIEVNAELDALRAVIPAALDALRVGGRIAVLSYHSLEDRIVKRAFVERCTSSTPPDLPVEPEPPAYSLITKGSEQPDESETVTNPRASSARLRGIERRRDLTSREAK